MKNLTGLDEEQLDVLPSRGKKRDGDRYHWGDDFPYRRVWRFLESRVGEPWDKVVSDFCHADWVPARRRHASELNRDVSTNTFLRDGEVWYYGKYGWWGCNESPIKDATRKTLYVHPTTKILSAFTPKSRPSRLTEAKRHNAKYMRSLGVLHQLLKVNGIWYEVKAKLDPYVIDAGWYRERTENDPLIDSEDIRFVGYGYSHRAPFPVRITSKKELSHKELRKHGLSNDNPPANKRCKVCGTLNCERDHAKTCPKCGVTITVPYHRCL